MSRAVIEVRRRWDGELLEAASWVRMELAWDGAGLDLRIDAPFWGEAAPEGGAGSCWGLWKYEVVELFLERAGGGYTEWEFGPWGHYLGLSFGGPRQMEGRELPLEYQARIEGDRWIGRARLGVEWLGGKPVRGNGYAIAGEEPRRYMAWAAVPGEQVDFHQPDRFEEIPWQR